MKQNLTGGTQPVSDTQYRIFLFIASHVKAHRCAPTHREINSRFGWASPTACRSHIKALEDAGYIRLTARAARGMELLVQPPLPPPPPSTGYGYTGTLRLQPR